MGEEKPSQFFLLMYMEGGDALRLSPDEWAEGLARGLQEELSDPHIAFKHVEDNIFTGVLTEKGAEALAKALKLDEFFPRIDIEAYELCDKPGETDYGFYVHFYHNLGDEFMSSEEEVKQLEGLNIIEDFEERCKCATVTLTEEEDEKGTVTQCHGYIQYEVNYLITLDGEKISVWTDSPIYTHALREYGEINKGKRGDIMRLFANYINYLISADITSFIDGYQKAPM